MDKKKVFTGILALSIVLNILFIITISSYNEKLDRIDNELRFIQSMNSNLSSEIYSLKNTIEEQDNFIGDVRFDLDIESVKIDDYMLNLSVSFKDLQEDEVPFIVYRAVNNEGIKETSYSEWTTVKLEEATTLSYETSLELSYSSNYEYKFVTEGSQKRSSRIEYLASNQYSHIQMEANSWSVSNNGPMECYINVYNNYPVEGYEVEKIAITIDDISKEYLATKLIEDDPSYGGYKKSGANFERYVVKFTKDDLDEIKDQVQEVPIFIKIELTCKNGFKVIDDLQTMPYQEKLDY